MAKRAEPSSAFVQRVRFAGSSSGPVKALRGFKKGHHTVPDAVNPATAGFLGKLCAGELAEEAEGFFQKSRAAFGYKRAELALEVNSPCAVLTTKDFVLEWVYALVESQPALFVLTRSLHSVRHTDFAALPACDVLFTGLFSELTFVLTKGVKVEAVIDAVESLAPGTDLCVDYPSDCRDCRLTVPGVSAAVCCDGSELTLSFPKSGTPRELMEAFLAVREAFALCRHPALASLL